MLTRQAVVNATDRVNASVVHINVLQDRASSKQPASDGQQRMGSGSGFDCRILPGISSSVPGTAVHPLREELLHRQETHASQMNRLKAPFRCLAANRRSLSSLKLRWRLKDRLFVQRRTSTELARSKLRPDERISSPCTRVAGCHTAGTRAGFQESVARFQSTSASLCASRGREGLLSS